MIRRWLPAAASVALVLLAGCGVDSDGRVHRIGDEDVPYGLLDPAAKQPVQQPGGDSVRICLLDDADLREVTRGVARGTDLRGIIGALGSLTDREAAQGLHTALGGPDEVRRVTVAEGTASVDFAPDTEQTITADPLATVAQIVCTLTAQPGIGRVMFSLAGAPIEVPEADGTLTDDPVSRDDYAVMLRD